MRRYPAGVSEQLLDRVRASVEGLTPGYFALVMASGILSVGMALKEYDILSLLMLLVCGTAFVVLLGLTVWRFVAYRSAINEDFLDPRRSLGVARAGALRDALAQPA